MHASRLPWDLCQGLAFLQSDLSSCESIHQRHVHSDQVFAARVACTLGSNRTSAVAGEAMPTNLRNSAPTLASLRSGNGTLLLHGGTLR